MHSNKFFVALALSAFYLTPLMYSHSLPLLTTERLLLRPPCLNDFEAIKQLCQDKALLTTFLKPLSDKQVHDFIEAEQSMFADYGFGRFVCVLPHAGQIIGLVGLVHPEWMPTLPWIALTVRILPEYQRLGYAKEALEAVVRDGFDRVGLYEIGVYVDYGNAPSRALFESDWARNQIGFMQAPHFFVNRSGYVLYRVSYDQWRKKQSFEYRGRPLERLTDFLKRRLRRRCFFSKSSYTIDT